jgi:hypothetical protein
MIFICRKVKIQMPARAQIVYFICNFPKDKFFLRKFNVKHKILQQNLKINYPGVGNGGCGLNIQEKKHKKTGSIKTAGFRLL